MSVHQSFRNEGAAARKAGKEVTANPYVAGTPAYEGWRDGYLAAAYA